MGGLAAEGGLRAGPPLGCARAAVGRVPAARGVGLRGAVRPPHDHPGRLLPVRLRLQPRLPQLAALPVADGVRRSGHGAGDPPLLDLAPARGLEPVPLRHRSAVRAGRPRHLERPRLLAAPRVGRVRPRHARHEVLRRAAALLLPQGEGERVGPHQARLPAPGVDARAARRLPDGSDGIDRRLVGLLDRVPPDDRVDARDRAARLRLPPARGARRPPR